MRYAVPVEDLLLFLRPNAVVFVHEVKEGALGLLQGRIGARLQVAQVGEYAFLEFLRVLHRPSKGLEAKRQAPYDIRAGDMEQVVPMPCQQIRRCWCALQRPDRTPILPQDARHIFAGGQQESADVLVRCPIHGRRYQEVFDCGVPSAPVCRVRVPVYADEEGSIASRCTHDCRLVAERLARLEADSVVLRRRA